MMKMVIPKNFDDFVVPILREKKNKFGDTFCFPYITQMPLTVIKILSAGYITNDVLCQLDLGAEGSFLFEKHLKDISYTKGDDININSSTGSIIRNRIYGFSLILELWCPQNKVKYSYIVPVFSGEKNGNGPLVTLRLDKDAAKTRFGLREIFANLGRDILVQHNIGLTARLYEGFIILERKLSLLELQNCEKPISMVDYPSLTGISLCPNK